METKTTRNFDFEELFMPLKEQVQRGEAKYADFEKGYYALKDASLNFQSLLEYAVRCTRDERLDSLFQRLAGENAADLIDKLRGIGYNCKKNKSLGDIFDKQGYRLLEQTRAGKRQNVFYGIMRIFISANKEVPKTLVEAFKPVYSDELFKVFIFSFLSGVLGQEDNSR